VPTKPEQAHPSPAVQTLGLVHAHERDAPVRGSAGFAPYPCGGARLNRSTTAPLWPATRAPRAGGAAPFDCLLSYHCGSKNRRSATHLTGKDGGHLPLLKPRPVDYFALTVCLLLSAALKFISDRPPWQTVTYSAALVGVALVNLQRGRRAKRAERGEGDD
jgi:hypothetical protein